MRSFFYSILLSKYIRRYNASARNKIKQHEKEKKILSKFLHLPVGNHLGLRYVTKFHSGEMILLFCSSNFHISFTKNNDENIKSKINTTNLNFVVGSYIFIYS